MKFHIIFFVSSFLMLSCRYNPIAETKQYKVTSVVKHGKQSDVTIAGLKGIFTLNSDTLKTNDLIEVTWIKRYGAK